MIHHTSDGIKKKHKGRSGGTRALSMATEDRKNKTDHAVESKGKKTIVLFFVGLQARDDFILGRTRTRRFDGTT